MLIWASQLKLQEGKFIISYTKMKQFYIDFYITFQSHCDWILLMYA